MPVERIEAHWDRQDPRNSGWYACAYTRDEEGELYASTDSMKVWWPVDLDGYDRGATDEVRAALAEAFPGAEIEVHS